MTLPFGAGIELAWYHFVLLVGRGLVVVYGVALVLLLIKLAIGGGGAVGRRRGPAGSHARRWRTGDAAQSRLLVEPRAWGPPSQERNVFAAATTRATHPSPRRRAARRRYKEHDP
jgi:hypothetical protein